MLANRSLEQMAEVSLIRMFSPDFFEMGREMVDRLTAAFMSDEEQMPSAEVLLAQIDALGKHDTLAELPSISVPTLVLGGKMDQMVPYLGSRKSRRPSRTPNSPPSRPATPA